MLNSLLEYQHRVKPGAVACARRAFRIGLPCVALVMGLNAVHAATPTNSPEAGSASRPLPAQPLPRLSADLKGAAAPDEVRLVADWIMRSNKHRGHPFVVADKVNSLLFAFDANGALLAKTLGLFGATRGDALTEEQANKTLAETLPSDMITPAGVFAGEAYVSPRYGKSVRFAKYANSNLLIHRAPNAKRVRRLQAPTASDTHITLGCINALPEFIDGVLVPHFRGESTVVVLPELQSARSFFAINDVPEPAPQAVNVTAGGGLRRTGELARAD